MRDMLPLAAKAVVVGWREDGLPTLVEDQCPPDRYPFYEVLVSTCARWFYSPGSRGE